MLNFEEQLKAIETDEDTGSAGLALIDDDPVFSFMLKDFLMTSSGLKTDHFNSGEDFLKEYKKSDERKIILDYNFEKGLSGIETLKKIKSINRDAFVIMVSSQDDLEKALDTLRKGASDYFLKTNKSVFANILCSILKRMEMEKNRWN